MSAVIVDVAGGPMGGAARFRDEFFNYLDRTGRRDVQVIGARRHLDPAWMLRRELAQPAGTRRVSLNNVGFISPGGERWTLLGNALHFLTEAEISRLEFRHQTIAVQAAIVRLAARRSHVLIAPCSAMAERIGQILPSVKNRLVVRMHPVSPERMPGTQRKSVILCPVLFYPYKHMIRRLREWISAVDEHIDPSVRMLVTAELSEVPPDLAYHPRLEFLGRLPCAELSPFLARSCAIYFPSGLESFGFPLAEARVSGRPVIAQDTAQNREIAGAALCGFTVCDADSLRRATELALTTEVAPDPAPFDPCAYFDWMLGPRA
jgi:hypothetical protein